MTLDEVIKNCERQLVESKRDMAWHEEHKYTRKAAYVEARARYYAWDRVLDMLKFDLDKPRE